MNRHPLIAIVVALCAALALACGGDGGSPTGPSAPSPPTSTVASLSGTINANTGGRIAGATVRILDGPNAGRTTTATGSGEYRFDTLTVSGATYAATASGYSEARAGITLAAGANTHSFTLERAALWSRSGTGADVFDKPAYVTRVRIEGRYDGGGENFIVWCGSSLLVNEILGTRWESTTYAGNHATPNCTQIEVRHSSGLAWSIAELR